MSVWIELARQQEAAGTEQGEYIDMLGRTAANTEYVGEPVEIERLKAENEQLRRRLGEAQAKADKAIAEAAELSQAIQSLMEESTGVMGYHLNGDVATWDWLLEHGWEMLRDTTTLAEEHLARDRNREAALRFYADTDNYRELTERVDGGIRFLPDAVSLDKGDRARLALGLEERE